MPTEPVDAPPQQMKHIFHTRHLLSIEALAGQQERNTEAIHVADVIKSIRQQTIPSIQQITTHQRQEHLSQPQSGYRKLIEQTG